MTPSDVTRITGFSQRWRERREWRVPARGVIAPERYQVDVLERPPAKAFCERHHYSGTFPAARLSVGLFEHGTGDSGSHLVGVTVFGVSMNGQVVPRHLGVESHRGVELSRLVLLDRVPGNAESWFMARAFRLLQREKPEIEAVVSYCDPVPRHSAAGDVVLPGHVGIVYQALNAVYRGRGSARTLLLAPSGRVVSERALSKIRNRERGHGYAESQLVALGAPPRRFAEAPRDWIERVRASDCLRSMRHPGNHVYAFGLTREARRHIRIEAKGALPYPKKHMDPEVPRS